MNKKWRLFFICALFLVPLTSNAQGINQKLAGKLLLQVEDKGRIWYVSPQTHTKIEVTFTNALPLFESQALGITNTNLERIPINLKGLNANEDSDNDGYTNAEELSKGYNPFGPGKLKIDQNFANKLAGKLLLQVEDKGRIWYVDFTGQRWEITWNNLMDVFRSLALGITNKDLQEIPTKALPAEQMSPLSQSPIICEEFSCLEKYITTCAPATVHMKYKEIPYFFLPVVKYHQTFEFSILAKKPDNKCQIQIEMLPDVSNAHIMDMTNAFKEFLHNQDITDDEIATTVSGVAEQINPSIGHSYNICEGTSHDYITMYNYDAVVVDENYSSSIHVTCDEDGCTSNEGGLTCKSISK